MKVTIEIPDNCELKQENGKYVIVEKKPTTYGDVARELFKDKYYFIDSRGNIRQSSEYTCHANNASSEKQLQKLLAINKLMNVAKYLNGDWKPDWNDRSSKWYIEIGDKKRILNIFLCHFIQTSPVYFKTEELAKRAIEIVGEEAIRLALCTDY